MRTFCGFLALVGSGVLGQGTVVGSAPDDTLAPPTPFETELELAVGIPLGEVRQRVARARLEMVYSCVADRGFDIDHEQLDHIAGVPLGLQEAVEAATSDESGSPWGGQTVDYAVFAQQTFEGPPPGLDLLSSEAELAILECVTVAEDAIDPLAAYDTWLQDVVTSQVDDAVRADPRFLAGREAIVTCFKDVGLQDGDLGRYLSSLTTRVDDAYEAWRAGQTSEATRDSTVTVVREQAEAIGPSLWACQRQFETVHVEVVADVQRDFLDEFGPGLHQVGQEVSANLQELGLA